MKLMGLFGKKSKLPNKRAIDEVACSIAPETTIEDTAKDEITVEQPEIKDLEEPMLEEIKEEKPDPDINRVLVDNDIYEYYKETICIVVALGEFRNLYNGRLHELELPLETIAQTFVDNSIYSTLKTGKYILALHGYYDIMKKVLINRELPNIGEEELPYALEELCGKYIVEIRNSFLISKSI